MNICFLVWEECLCKKAEWWGAGMVICLGRVADLHVARLMLLPLTVSSCKSRLVLTSWYWLTRVVPDRGPLSRYSSGSGSGSGRMPLTYFCVE